MTEQQINEWLTRASRAISDRLGRQVLIGLDWDAGDVGIELRENDCEPVGMFRSKTFSEAKASFEATYGVM